MQRPNQHSIFTNRAVTVSAPLSLRGGRKLVALAMALALGPLVFTEWANGAPPDFPGIPLGPRARGEAALARLGARLPQVAAFYGTTDAELRGLFRRDNTLWIDREGALVYVCEAGPLPAQAETANGDGQIAEGPLPADQTFFLHSRPGATKVIYLDFNGHVTSGTSWNSSYRSGQDIVTPPYDTDGNPSTFSAAELDTIQYIWQRVTEDFAPFDVDVTTQDPGVDALRKTTSSDANYGVRVCIGGSSGDWYNGSAGGVAYIGSFNWNSDTPCFVFPAQLGGGAEKYTADAAIHEAGHTLGLNHDGVTGGTAYYAGHGNWAPIMGLGYYVEITHWSKGEYSQANNTQDDLAVMQTYGISYRADDHGNTIPSATPLYGSSVSASGVIERRTDADVFSFQTGAGAIQFTVNPAPRAPNLDILVTLHDGSGNLLASANPVSLNATLSATVATGTYYLLVDGVGAGDLTTGYSDYASLGQYNITGTLVPTGALQPPVPVASASPSSGAAPFTVNFSSAGSSDPDGTIVSYDWELENGISSAEPNPSHVYSTPGTYNALLIVTDNDGLSRSTTVTITATSPPNQSPVAVASAPVTTGYAPLAVNFSSAGSSDPDGTVAAYAWNFGDGSTSTAAHPSHTYMAAGNYTATLTVTDNQEASSSRTLTISAQQDSNKVVFVQNITMSLVPSSSGTAARAEVTVVDGTGALRQNATVSGKWTGLTTGAANGTTDSTGKVRFTSKKVRKTGTYTFTITGISAAGYVYDSTRNLKTANSISR